MGYRNGNQNGNLACCTRLIRGLALRQCMLETAPVSVMHVKGTDNALADIALRPITQLDDDSAFLTHFDTVFPFQDRFWQRARPPPVQLSNVISTLRGQRSTLQCWMVQSVPPTGDGGASTAPSVELIHGSRILHPRPRANYCRALPPGLELDTLGKVGKLAPKPSKKSCITWHKPLCWKDTLTPDALLDPEAPTWLCPLPTCLNPTQIKTLSPSCTAAHQRNQIGIRRSLGSQHSSSKRPRSCKLNCNGIFLFTKSGQIHTPST